MTHSDINFNKKTILITGGAGFIGSNIAFYFQKNYPDAHIVIFDCFRNELRFSNGNLRSFGHYKNLIGFNGDIICGNINNKTDLAALDNYSFDFIFHQAAISDTRVYDQEIIMQTNINSFYTLLNKAKQDKAKLVYASSAATYGSQPSPQTVGKEKPENVYGPNEYYKSSTSSMVIQLGHQILNGKAPRLFQGSKNISRDFIYIDDVIQSNIKACNPKLNGTYNIGTGISRNFQDIADILQKELDTNLGTEYFPNPYNDYQLHTQADISSSRENLGFVPKFSLEDGIKAYIPEIKRLFNTEIA